MCKLIQYPLCLLFFILINVPATAQNQDVQYLDQYCRPVGEADAVYYRIIEKKDTVYIIRDYYVSNDTLEMEAFCTSIFPKMQYEGRMVLYYENGNMKSEGSYEQNKEKGLFKEYYEDGAHKNEIIYRPDEKPLYCQYWSAKGEPYLLNGTGMAFEMSNDIVYNLEVEDSILIAYYHIRAEKGDSIYSIVEKSAEYKGGMEGFYKGLSKNLAGKYPRMARRMEIEGRVFIGFIINKKGAVTEAKVLKGIGGGCDEVALEAFRQLNEWEPAIHKKKPVKQRMVLPVVFKLN